MRTFRSLFLAAAGCLTAVSASAQILIAGWDFTNGPGSGTYNGQIAATHSDVTGDWTGTGTSPAAVRGTLYTDGTNGSDAWTQGSLGTRTLGSGNGGTVNATVSSLRRTNADDPLYLKNLGTISGTAQGLQLRRADSSSPDEFSLVLDTTGTAGGLTVSFAADFVGTTSPSTTITWFYKIGSGATVATGQSTTVSGTAFAPYSVTFATAALNGEPIVAIIGQIGTVPASNPLLIDNIQVTAPTLTGGVTSPPTITSAASASATVGVPFSYQTTTTNPAGVPISFSTSTSTLYGLSLDPLTGAVSGTPTSVPAGSGNFTLALRAINPAGPASLSVLITISPNTSGPPVINSPTAATGAVGAAFSYTITASNSPTSYNAAVLPAGLSINTATGVISGTPTAAGTSTVTLTATNGSGSDTETLTLTINPAAPTVTSPASASGTVGVAFSYSITGTNSPTDFAAVGLPSFLSLNPITGVISGTPTAAGSYSVTLRAINAGGTGSLNATFSFGAAGSPPTITSITSASGTVGVPFTYTIAATNSPTTYGASGLPGWLSLNSSTGVLSGTPTASGPFTIGLSATNASGTGNATLTLTIASNDPVITSPSTASGRVGSAFSYAITATLSPTSFTAGPLPAGLSFNATTGVISGTPTATGTSSVTITATNASGGTGQATLTITILPATPVISSSLTATAVAGSPFTYSITATNSPTSFGASSLPAGLSVDSSTGLISGTPTAAGSATIAISATNAGGTGSANLALTIHPPAPVISSSASASGTVGQAFAYNIVASGSPTSYAATGLPSGLSIDSTTGVISGTPSVAGTSSVTLSATNAGGTGTLTLSLTLGIAPVPQIDSAASATGLVGQAFSYTITATNSPTSFAASGLPAGLSLDSSTGVISGTPTLAGVASVSLQATNANGSGVFTLTLTINSAPVITSSGTASGSVGTAFHYAIVATHSPTAYAATGLPTGLSVNSTTGAISGTPTAGGTFTINLSATNTYGTGSRTLTLTIATPAPVITSATTVTATAGAAFSYTITATNAPTSFGATGLPAGLSLNSTTGVISGTPTTAGTSTVALSATNSGGTGTATLTLTVSPAPQPPTITSATTANGRVGTAFTFTVTATNPPITFAATGLPAGLSLNATTGVISGTPTAAGTFTVNLTATNAIGPANGTLTITILPRAPVITSTNRANGQVDVAFTYTIVASNAATSYTASGLPPGLALNATTGAISGVPLRSGSYPVALTASNAGGEGTLTLTLTIATAERPLLALSARGITGANHKAMIVGFNLEGYEAMPVLLRVTGPSLGRFGLKRTLTDPSVRLFRGSEIIAQNDDWSTASTAAALNAMAAQVGSFEFASGSKDAALLLNLAPGIYTAMAATASGEGTALLEAYEAGLDGKLESRMRGMSIRGEVRDGEQVLIAGIAIGGSKTRRILIRALGPELAKYGVEGPLTDPRLQLFDGETPSLANDNWGQGEGSDPATIAAAVTKLGLSPLPAGSRDSALVVTLPSGSTCTAHVSSGSGASGVTLLEVYLLE